MPKTFQSPLDRIKVQGNIEDRVRALEAALQKQQTQNVGFAQVSDAAPDAGLFQVGNYQSGTGSLEGGDLTGTAMLWPGININGEVYTLVGMNNGVLQFGLSSIDGTAFTGAGAVILSSNGISIPDGGDAIMLYDSYSSQYTFLATRSDVIANGAFGITTFIVNSETNQITNGDFETGSFSSWTVVDPSSKLSVIQESTGNYAAKFAAGVTSSAYIQQALPGGITTGLAITMQVKCAGSVFATVNVGNTVTPVIFAFVGNTGGNWRNVVLLIPGASSTFRLSVTSSAADVYVDNILVRVINSGSVNFDMSPGQTIIPHGYLQIGNNFFSARTSLYTTKNPGAYIQDVLFLSGGGSYPISGTISDLAATIGQSFDNSNGFRLNPSTASTVQTMGFYASAADVISTTATDFAGKTCAFYNVGSFPITFKDQSAALGTATSRFNLGGSDLTLPPNGSITFFYDGTDTRWRIWNINSFPQAETNANDIFRCSNPTGASSFSGTINGTPSGVSVVYNAGFTGTDTALVPASTSQLAKMRLYNTTRGNNALISNCNTGTKTITLTATVPANWANGDTITIASQTVIAANMFDLEITSGPTGRSNLFIKGIISSASTAIQLRVHPFESFSSSKYAITADTQVANIQLADFGLVKVTSNVFSMFWNGAVTFVILREEGYLS